MEHNTASATALITAFARAYHSGHAERKIFDDYLAGEILTREEMAFFGSSLAQALPFFNPELAATGPDQATALDWVMKVQNAPITISRARYTEDRLKAAIRQGVEQYVILGAGLETFAFRETELLEHLHVYEVDHPATQALKQQRLAELGWDIPPRLEFVPADFSKQALADVLSHSSYDPGRKSFFSWLGVAYYLPEAAVSDTLHSLSAIASPGSALIFDYIDTHGFDPEVAAVRMQRMRTIVARMGEPMQTAFDPHTLAEGLQPLGLRLEENLGPAEIEALYFQDRTDGYHAFEHVHFALATIIH